MNQLPLELIYIVGCKVRDKCLYDYKQIGKYTLDLNINDPYIEIIKDNEHIKKVLYKNKFHSINGECACEGVDGTKWWYYNDKLHRLDGPAIEFSNGDKYWLKDGLKHREDGPAIEWSNGHKLWYQNDKLYRKWGPTVERPLDNN
jgi:hypothetical protein